MAISELLKTELMPHFSSDVCRLEYMGVLLQREKDLCKFVWNSTTWLIVSSSLSCPHPLPCTILLLLLLTVIEKSNK